MARNLNLSKEARQQSAEVLSKVLADTFVLYLKTHGFHWNVEGAQFLALHHLFEEQYRDLWTSLDEIAERIRALGEPAPATTDALKALAEVKETDHIPSAKAMLDELVSDNEAVTRTIRAALSVAEDAGDEATAGLLADRLAYHEKQVWMMKSITAA